MWEDFEYEKGNEDESMEDDLEFDREYLHNTIKRLLEENPARAKALEQNFKRISDLLGVMNDENNAQEIRDKQKKLWYEKFCKEMLKGKKLKKVSIVVDDLEIMEAAQEVTISRPEDFTKHQHNDSYIYWLTYFDNKDETGKKTTEFLQVLDAMGYHSDILENLDNPQDFLDL